MPSPRVLFRTIALLAAAAVMAAASSSNERAVQKAFEKAARQYLQQSTAYDTFARRFATQTLTKLSKADEKHATSEEIHAIADAAVARLEEKSTALVNKIFAQHDKNLAKLTALKATDNDFVQLGYLFGDATSLIVQLTSDITIGIQETANLEIAD